MANIKLSWPGSSSATYEVQFKKAGDATWSEPNLSPVTGNQILLMGLEDDTDYTFRYRVLCSAGISAWDYEVFTTPVAGCVPPTNLALSAVSETSITASWTVDSSSVNGQMLEYKAEGNINWVSLLVGSATSYTIGGLTPGTKYQVRVSSLCAGDSQATTAEQSTTTLVPYSPCTGVGVTVGSITAQSTNYKITWTNTGFPASHVLQYSTDGGSTWTNLGSYVISQSTTQAVYTVPGALDFPVDHMIKVIAKGSDGCTADEDTATYEAPAAPETSVDVENALNTSAITSVTVDDSINLLSGNLLVGDTVAVGKNGILTGLKDVFITCDTLPTGTNLKIEHIRASSTLTTKYVKYGGPDQVILSNTDLDQDDTIKISQVA